MRVAEFVAETEFAALPPAVRAHASRTFFNFVGCALGGARHESVSIADATLAPLGAAVGATVLGRGAQRGLELAALLNGMSSAVYSFDDTHAEAVVHPGGPVGSALLALAEQRPANGERFLTAYALGVETTCRVSKAVSVAPAQGDAGWIQTGITGGIGAAAACAKLLGLDAARLAHAVGIAASTASGMRGVSRSMCFSYMAGNAAANGLRAALLAERGFTSGEDALAAPFGFAAVFARAAHLEALTDGLGARYELMANAFKPYPCGVIAHPVIDAALSLRNGQGLVPEELDRLTVRLNPAALRLAGPRHPKDPFEAAVSVHHWAAAAIADGAAGIEQSLPERLADPAIVRLRERIELVEDGGIARDGAFVEAVREARPVLECRIAHCSGSAANPLSEAAVEKKFEAQAGRALAPAAIERLVDLCARLATLEDAGAIARAAAGAQDSR